MGQNVDTILKVTREHEALRLLVLFGSRGRGEETPRSDWDLGYIADGSLDVAGLRADLISALQTEEIDLVDLDRANGLLRYRAARDGRPIFESEEQAFERFWLAAVGFWCDAESVLEESYDAVLEGLSE